MLNFSAKKTARHGSVFDFSIFFFHFFYATKEKVEVVKFSRKNREQKQRYGFEEVLERLERKEEGRLRLPKKKSVWKTRLGLWGSCLVVFRKQTADGTRQAVKNCFCKLEDGKNGKPKNNGGKTFFVLVHRKRSFNFCLFYFRKKTQKSKTKKTQLEVARNATTSFFIFFYATKRKVEVVFFRQKKRGRRKKEKSFGFVFVFLFATKRKVEVVFFRQKKRGRKKTLR